MYLVIPDDVDDEEIDPMYLALLESSSAPIVKVPAEAEEAVEDAAEDESIPSLQSDYSILKIKKGMVLLDPCSSGRWNYATGCKRKLNGKGRPPTS